MYLTAPTQTPTPPSTGRGGARRKTEAPTSTPTPPSTGRGGACCKTEAPKKTTKKRPSLTVNGIDNEGGVKGGLPIFDTLSCIALTDRYVDERGQITEDIRHVSLMSDEVVLEILDEIIQQDAAHPSDGQLCAIEGKSLDGKLCTVEEKASDGKPCAIEEKPLDGQLCAIGGKIVMYSSQSGLWHEILFTSPTDTTQTNGSVGNLGDNVVTIGGNEKDKQVGTASSTQAAGSEQDATNSDEVPPPTSHGNMVTQEIQIDNEELFSAESSDTEEDISNKVEFLVTDLGKSADQEKLKEGDGMHSDVAGALETQIHETTTGEVSTESPGEGKVHEMANEQYKTCVQCFMVDGGDDLVKVREINEEKEKTHAQCVIEESDESIGKVSKESLHKGNVHEITEDQNKTIVQTGMAESDKAPIEISAIEVQDETTVQTGMRESDEAATEISAFEKQDETTVQTGLTESDEAPRDMSAFGNGKAQKITEEQCAMESDGAKSMISTEKEMAQAESVHAVDDRVQVRGNPHAICIKTTRKMSA